MNRKTDQELSEMSLDHSLSEEMRMMAYELLFLREVVYVVGDMNGNSREETDAGLQEDFMTAWREEIEKETP
jgi:hypothetical protein